MFGLIEAGDGCGPRQDKLRRLRVEKPVSGRGTLIATARFKLIVVSQIYPSEPAFRPRTRLDAIATDLLRPDCMGQQQQQENFDQPAWEQLWRLVIVWGRRGNW